MENLGETQDMQTSFFDSESSKSLFFITTQRNLMAFLGSGMLLPRETQFRYKVDSREMFNGAIPFWKGGVPSSDNVLNIADGERIVIIECHEDDVLRYSAKSVVYEDENVIALNCPIPLVCIVCFHMRSKEIIDDFIVRLPDDVIFDREYMQVIADLPELEIKDSYDYSSVESLTTQINFIDSIGGGVKALLRFMSDGIKEYSYITDLLHLCLSAYENQSLEHSSLHSDRHQYTMSPSDQSIFLTLLFILRDLKVEDGIDSISLLERLMDKLNSGKSNLSEETLRWADYVRDAILGEKEVPTLADERDIFKRAVLLFFLRPDISRLEKSNESSISPGPSVLSIAGFLAGFTTGLTRLGSPYKGDYKAFNRFTRSLLNCLWGKSKIKLSVDRVSNAPFGVYEVYEINNEELFKLEVRQNVVLSRVLNQAKSAGYQLEYDYNNHELTYIFKFNGERSQRVYIELISPLSSGIDVIRFVSPCMDLSGRNKNKLKKDIAIDFLKRNASNSMYCAFAYSEKRQAIVVEAIQIVRTMDDDEFITLFNYVAKVADEYERQVLDQDIY